MNHFHTFVKLAAPANLREPSKPLTSTDNICTWNHGVLETWSAHGKICCSFQVALPSHYFFFLRLLFREIWYCFSTPHWAPGSTGQCCSYCSISKGSHTQGSTPPPHKWGFRTQSISHCPRWDSIHLSLLRINTQEGLWTGVFGGSQLHRATNLQGCGNSPI